MQYYTIYNLVSDDIIKIREDLRSYKNIELWTLR